MTNEINIQDYPSEFHNSILNLWKCKYCFYKLNAHFSHKCDNCDRYKDLECFCIWCETDWRCDKCSYTNIGTDMYCEKCNNHNKQKLSQEQISEMKTSNIDIRCSQLLFRQNANIYNLFDIFILNNYDVRYLNLHNMDLPTDDNYLKTIIQDYRIKYNI